MLEIKKENGRRRSYERPQNPTTTPIFISIRAKRAQRGGEGVYGKQVTDDRIMRDYVTN